MKTVLIFLAAVLIAFTATAQQGINYKALVKDNLGNVVANQTIDVRFTIIADTGPTNVYVETHTGVATDANGIVILNIGEGTTSDVFTDIAWGSDTHALKVEIDIEQDASFVDMGTTQFMAVPYALSAANTASKIDELTDGKSDANGSSLFLGIDAGLNDDGTDNNNVGIGYQALYSNTVGLSNIANGYQALYSNNAGGFNIANGYQALYNNFIGFHNIATGYKALFNNTSGPRNTAYGSWALYNNLTGGYNTANGYQALFSNTIGARNVANGYEALRSNTEGDRNIAIGFQALWSNIDGDYNTANGYQALYSNTEGIYNTANGYQALYSNTRGDHNIANGFEALRNNIEGNQNTANGYKALFNNTIGNRNTAYGVLALSSNTTGDNNTAIGHGAQTPSTIGSNQVKIGNMSVTWAGIQVAWTVTSDLRWKENIRVLPYGLAFVKQLQPVDYMRKNNEHKTREMGFIAQNVEALLTKVGYTEQGFLTKDDKGFMSLRYNDFIALLTKAIQEQQDIIDSLQSTVGSQQSEIKSLQSAVFSQQSDFNTRLKQIEQKLNTTQQ
ncbi:tail fiber domain-containing protein [uncultured Algibacter sp.]|uniref:tail fiber domain-containing protein n=1 Tax=uncultured Algibacter sp. TaxID=298659 RepID=UPI0030ECD3EC